MRSAPPGEEHDHVAGGATELRRKFRVFTSVPGEPRFRRPTDALLLSFALIALACLIVAYPPSELEQSLSAFLDSVPDWLQPLWGFLYDLAWLWAGVLLAMAIGARRWGIVLQSLAALVLGALVAIVAARLATGNWPDLADAVLGRTGASAFPAVRLGETAAVIVTVAGHLVLPLERTGRWILGLGAIGALFASGATPSGVLAALLVAVAAATGVRLALGTSAGRPRLADIRSGLTELDVAAESVTLADRQTVGLVTAEGYDTDGRRLVIKVYGRDAYGTQVLARLWRRLWYKESALLAVGPSLQQAVEHEALVTLLAARAGVPTKGLVTAGTSGGDALLVLHDGGTAVADLPADAIDGDLLQGAWRALAQLADAKIAHLALDTSTVVLVDGHAGLADFTVSTLAPTPEQLSSDRAQMLATTAAVAGDARAVAAAVDALGADGITAVLPYLQPCAFSPSLRRALKRAGIDVNVLRKQTAAAADVKPPDLVPLRRVTVKGVIQIALMLMAAAAVIGFFGGIDLGELGPSLADASWGWLALAFIVAQLPRLTQSVATLGTVPIKLPYGPVYAMQLATGYINLAVPSAVGGVAVGVRFLQRQGLTTPAAAASGVVGSLASTVVQVVLVLLILLFSGSSVSLGVSASDASGSPHLLWILLAALVVSGLVVALVPRTRRAVIGYARRWLPQVRSTLGVLRSPNKLALLLVGNVATEVLFAIALGLFANGLGYPISLTDLILINTGVSLLSNFIPVPGGIGVTEAGLIIGLTSVGMPQAGALAAALLYRIATFYVPPVWDFFAMRWLERNRYL